jgi:ethanolamine utilization protein EutA
LKSRDVDTGAVILTGEAIRRDNARAIADLFAGERGNFVCATAGHHFEALLAAYGSGTVALSQERSFRLLNVDVGGGTTKLSVVEGGRVIETAALHLGGRLVATDEQGRILVLEPGGAAVAQAAGLSLELGRQASLADLEQVADWMADALLAAVRDAQPRPEVSDLFLTPRLKGPASYDGVVFSGGVGEYVYGKETASFGDLGQPFGRALGQRLTAGALPWPLLPAQECIRATVVGASQHSVQVSGNTIYASDTESLLPQRNLQVLRPDCDLSGDIHPEAIAQAIGRHFARFDLVEGESNVALVFQWEGDASFQRLNSFFDGLLGGIPRALTAGRPIVLVFDNDIGGIVGVTLREERQLSNDILSIDGITLRDFDFIDIGRILEPSGTVPVTIKSLIFQL